MSERTNITNLLLLSVLAGILLVSGSLQCAFDCLTQVDSLQTTSPLHSQSNRIDSCHPSIDHGVPTISCLNKACHQRLPHHRNLDGPEIYRLENLAQPLYSSTRQPTPLYRAGNAIIIPPRTLPSQSRPQTTTSNITPQSLSSIRTTVILC